MAVNCLSEGFFLVSGLLKTNEDVDYQTHLRLDQTVLDNRVPQVGDDEDGGHHHILREGRQE